MARARLDAGHQKQEMYHRGTCHHALRSMDLQRFVVDTFCAHRIRPRRGGTTAAVLILTSVLCGCSLFRGTYPAPKSVEGAFESGDGDFIVLRHFMYGEDSLVLKNVPLNVNLYSGCVVGEFLHLKLKAQSPFYYETGIYICNPASGGAWADFEIPLGPPPIVFYTVPVETLNHHGWHLVYHGNVEYEPGSGLSILLWHPYTDVPSGDTGLSQPTRFRRIR